MKKILVVEMMDGLTIALNPMFTPHGDEDTAGIARAQIKEALLHSPLVQDVREEPDHATR